MQAMSMLALPVALVLGVAQAANPLGTTLTLIDELAAKITKDGEVEAKAYADYVEWCDDTAKNTAFAITTAEREKGDLEAKIGELKSDISSATSNVEGLASSIADDDSKLKEATAIHNKETADFEASEAEMVDAVDTLGRAIGVLEKEMAKNPAMLQQVDTKNMVNVAQALSVVLDAASFSSKDQAKLSAFIQAQQGDDDSDMGAPAGDAYKTHSTGILDVLEDMKEKAETELSDLRKAEVDRHHNFEMLKQSLEDGIAADTKDMNEEKANKAKAAEAQATAEGDLKMTNKELAASKQQLATAHSTCLQVAADHEATVAARDEELKAIAKAKKILVESTSGAESQTYSLVQVSATQALSLAGSEVVAAVKQLAKKEHSAALAQLASRIASALRLHSSDPFGKVKGLITEMIAKLEKEAGADATEKAYCDEQMAKTEAKKGELEEDVAKATSRIDQATSRSAQLKEEVQALESELASLAKEQAEMDKIRQETHADYTVAKADLEAGLTGVRKALEVLREYYGGAAAMLQDDSKLGAFMQQPEAPETFSKSSGAGGSIIDILQVVESDFATNLAKEETEEEDAQAEYEKVSQENAITKTTKDSDVKYKVQESKQLAKTIADFSSDRESASTQLSAVLDYYGKIKARCIAKPETYAARAEARAAEIKGLKQALSILEDETALVQRKRRGGNFRGTLSA